MTEDENGHDRPIRYSKKNIPLSVEDARDALEELEDDILYLDIALKYKNDHDFPDYDEYKTWKQRAMGAMAHMVREQRFVKEWLIEQGRKVDTRPKDDEGAPLIVLEMEKLAKAKAAGLEPAVISLLENSTPDIRVKLEALQRKIQAERDLLILQCTERGLGSKRRKRALVSMQSLDSRVESRLASITVEEARRQGSM